MIIYYHCTGIILYSCSVRDVVDIKRRSRPGMWANSPRVYYCYYCRYSHDNTCIILYTYRENYLPVSRIIRVLFFRWYEKKYDNNNKKTAHI